MKIISKYKDYYDYLSGIYGEDPLKILDRREVDPSDNIRTIVFCDKIYIKGLPEHVFKRISVCSFVGSNFILSVKIIL